MGNNDKDAAVPVQELDEKIDLILRTGQLLMGSGADTNRITRTMKRTAAFMGIEEKNMHIHITYTTIMINVNNGSIPITKFQKCINHGIDMTKISAISKLSWRCAEKNYTLKDYEYELNRIFVKQRQYSNFQTIIGAGLACGGFCVLFGGDLLAFFYTSICAAIGFAVRSRCNKFAINSYASIAIASFCATALAYVTHFMPGSLTPWHPLLACALFIVPGIPLINSVEDLLDNFIVSGMTRAVNTTLMVGSMSFGIVLAVKLYNVADFTTLSTRPDDPYYVYALAGAISAIGFSTIFNVPRRLLWVVALGGMIAVCTRNFLSFNLALGLATGSFTGAMLVSFIAIKVVHCVHTPIHVITLPSVIPMIPGVFLYRLMFGIINIEDMTSTSLLYVFQSGVIACLTILAIAVGVAIPHMFAKKYMERGKNKKFQVFLTKRDRTF